MFLHRFLYNFQLSFFFFLVCRWGPGEVSRGPMIQHVCPVALAPALRVPSVVWFEAVEVRQGVTLCFATVIRASLSLSLSLPVVDSFFICPRRALIYLLPPLLLFLLLHPPPHGCYFASGRRAIPLLIQTHTSTHTHTHTHSTTHTHKCTHTNRHTNTSTY